MTRKQPKKAAPRKTFQWSPTTRSWRRLKTWPHVAVRHFKLAESRRKNKSWRSLWSHPSESLRASMQMLLYSPIYFIVKMQKRSWETFRRIRRDTGSNTAKSWRASSSLVQSSLTKCSNGVTFARIGFTNIRNKTNSWIFSRTIKSQSYHNSESSQATIELTW